MEKHEFNIPNFIDGAQLKAELNCDDVYIHEDKLYILGDLTEAEAAAGLKAHKEKPKVEPTISEKLASVGLSIDDLKAALGI
jgi:hypothetical protein